VRFVPKRKLLPQWKDLVKYYTMCHRNYFQTNCHGVGERWLYIINRDYAVGFGMIFYLMKD
jgi:hypothetical protein